MMHFARTHACTHARMTRARARSRVCVYMYSSLFLLVTTHTRIRRPFPSVYMLSAIQGVTASFGWVRAKETDRNKSGDMRDEVGETKKGRWGVCQILLPSLRAMRPRKSAFAEFLSMQHVQLEVRSSSVPLRSNFAVYYWSIVISQNRQHLAHNMRDKF